MSTVEISLDSLTQNINPAEDIVLKAYDTITAETAQPVYRDWRGHQVVFHPAGRSAVDIGIAGVDQAGGLTPGRESRKGTHPAANYGHKSAGGRSKSIYNRIIAGKDNDFPLLPNDVLYVPRDSVRAVLAPVGTGMLTTLPYLIVTFSYSGTYSRRRVASIGIP